MRGQKHGRLATRRCVEWRPGRRWARAPGEPARAGLADRGRVCPGKAAAPEV